MPVDYSKRREAWLKQTEQWPPTLREKISVRNIEAVLKLPASAQATLAAALDLGALSIPAAIQYLKDHPQATAEDLLPVCQKARATGKRTENATDSGATVRETGDTAHSGEAVVQSDRSPSHTPGPLDIAALADLYQYAHPGAHRIVAEAWAEDPKWASLLDLVHAWRTHIKAPPGTAHSETVIVVTCAFLVKIREQLDQVIAERPAYRQALKMSGVSND